MIAISKRWRCINCPNWLYKYPAATVMHVMPWLVRRYVLSCSWTRKKVVLWAVAIQQPKGCWRVACFGRNPMNDRSPPHGLGMSLRMVEVNCFFFGIKGPVVVWVTIISGGCCTIFFFVEYTYTDDILYSWIIYIYTWNRHWNGNVALKQPRRIACNGGMVESWNGIWGWDLDCLIMKLHRWKDLYHDFVTCSQLLTTLYFTFVLYIIYRPIVRKQWVVDLHCGCMVED